MCYCRVTPNIKDTDNAGDKKRQKEELERMKTLLNNSGKDKKARERQEPARTLPERNAKRQNTF